MKHLLTALVLSPLLLACGSTDDGDVRWEEGELKSWKVTCTMGHDWSSPDFPNLAAALGAARDHNVVEHEGRRAAKVVEE